MTNGGGKSTNHDYPDSVDMPAPSFWPMILAFGVTLLLAGIVTDYVVTSSDSLCRSAPLWVGGAM